MTGIATTVAAALAVLIVATFTGWQLADRVPAVEAFSDRLAATLCQCDDCADRAARRRADRAALQQAALDPLGRLLD